MNKFIKTNISLPLNKEAPTEFRIWKFGNNLSDYGDALFTENSAKILMEEQKKRGNLYSIDYNHMSLADNVNPEATKAAGWHELQVKKDDKGNPELWAINVDWTPLAKAGLEAKVPEWRYFSPAFYVDQETKEIISYTNTALCINPATHNNTMLASRKYSNNLLRKTIMDTEKEKLVALKHLMSLVGDANVPEETKKVLQASIDQLVADLGGKEKVDEMLKAEVAEETTTTVEIPKPVLEAKKESSDVKLAVTIAELTERLNKQDVEKVVLANLNSKIPMALKEWALEQNMDTITQYLAKAPLLSTDKVTQVKTTVAPIKGDNKNSTPVNPEVNFIQNCFGIYSQPMNTEIISKDFINGTTNVRAINVPTPRQLKAAKAASKK